MINNGTRTWDHILIRWDDQALLFIRDENLDDVIYVEKDGQRTKLSSFSIDVFGRDRIERDSAD